MPTYRIKIGSEQFDINSPSELTDAQAFQAALPEYHKVRDEQAAAEARGRAMGGQYKIGAEGLSQAAHDVGAGEAPETLAGVIPEGLRRLAIGIGEAAQAAPGATVDAARKAAAFAALPFAPSLAAQLVASRNEPTPDVMQPVRAGISAVAPQALDTGPRALPLAMREAVARQTVEGAGLTGKAGSLLTSAGIALGTPMPGGAALPKALSAAERAAAGEAAGAVPGVVPGAVKAAVPFTEASRGAALARAAGEDPAALAARIEAGIAEAERMGVPVTTAQAARSPQLSATELGYRGLLPEEFPQLARQQSESLYGAVERATQESERLPVYEKIREQATAPMREAALEAAREGNYAAPVAQHVETLLSGPSGANPAVQSVGKYVQSQLESGKLTPERLYEVRKVLAQKLSSGGALTDELGAAARGARRETTQLIERIDQSLDAASGGQWTPYLQRYARLSKPVESAQASQELRDLIGTPTRPLMGTRQQVTAHTLGKDIERVAASDFGPRFRPERMAELNAIRDFAKQIEEPMRTLKAAGTGGGGSQTTTQIGQAMKAAGGLVGEAAPGLFNRVVGALSSAEQKAFARLMLNPREAAQALRAAAATGRALTPAEQAFTRIATHVAGRQADQLRATLANQ